MRDYTPEELLALSDERFLRVAEDEVRSMSTAEGPVARKTSLATSAALRAPEVIDRFRTALRVLQRGVEGRLAAKKARLAVQRIELLGTEPGRPSAEYLEAVRKYAEDRARALRFKTSLDQTMVSVAGDKDRLACRIGMLEAGIRKWWTTFTDEQEPDDADRELWQLVDGGVR